jgi:hypothetical protein
MANVRLDRFGNKSMSIFCKNNKNGYPQGYVEVGSKFFKIEPGKEESTAKDGTPGYWVKMTEVKKLSPNDKKF